ncbi:MAG: hypothetical protein A3J46_02565 [Candidatus Yanofskybacteria bacterium RIFCSPHIGHO2_02_FULL_41_11]|uniref:Uncharacterized protein n=1 Tax=Candidatus Yanofskybacteria bacterium RIFCSPHIGHO2_02_FULL_41_11 TaxID=1802675 RepID=A0A1F8F8I0_9BACT|nr:MAG: hypothetical protein A3J46_02565 [Candidatus Yanofskybacteria bacterium RIFCSPHIGHO2_02_FULL_41_11]
MRFEGSKEFPGSIEGTVRFDEETLCALERGLEQNPEVAEQLEEIVGEKAKIFRDILSNTLDPKHRAPIKFVPNDEARTFYSQIAKRKLERIDAEDEDDEDLTCSHSVDEHRRALEIVVEKMTPTVN